MGQLLRFALGAGAFLALSFSVSADPSASDLGEQVDAVERAFAKTMADRDLEAFASFLSDEAIFGSGSGVRHGKDEVIEHWKKYFVDEKAPFSWEPETVSVLESGTLALSTGPVYNAAGRRTSTYTSIWRLEEPGVWRIIFDRGNKYCE